MYLREGLERSSNGSPWFLEKVLEYVNFITRCLSSRAARWSGGFLKARKPDDEKIPTLVIVGEANNQLLDILSKVRKETRSFSAEEAR